MVVVGHLVSGWAVTHAGDAVNRLRKDAAMLQTTVSLIDAERAVHMSMHDGLVDIFLAALSAEPTTIDELKWALGRFIDAEVIDQVFAGAEPGEATRPGEGGHLLIDFAARLVVNGTIAPEMPRVGSVLSCNAETTLKLWLPYRIPEQWQTTTDTRRWRALADRRRPQFTEECALDVRAILYGALAASLIDRWLARVGGPHAVERYEIQDWWLLTQREDLRGLAPRDVLLQRQKWIDGDVADQAENWSLSGRCPPGLPQKSFGFRHAGFGTHEIVLYHELTAVLLREVEARHSTGRPAARNELISHLEQLQQEWLHQPQEELYDQSPAALIARERARLPAVVPKDHIHLDADCPLCRMMAESDQPMLWQLDSFHLQTRYATSFCRSTQEWDRFRREADDWLGDHPWDESAEPVVPSEIGLRDKVWANSFTNMSSLAKMPDWESVNVMLFAIGGHMAELVQDLRQEEVSDQVIGALHVAFDELRVHVRDDRDLVLVQSAIAEFSEAIGAARCAGGAVEAKCCDLESKLEFLEKRYAQHRGQDLEATP
jgi:hypothetical protein